MSPNIELTLFRFRFEGESRRACPNEYPVCCGSNKTLVWSFSRWGPGFTYLICKVPLRVVVRVSVLRGSCMDSRDFSAENLLLRSTEES
jgi:hypothetical protein